MSCALIFHKVCWFKKLLCGSNVVVDRSTVEDDSRKRASGLLMTVPVMNFVGAVLLHGIAVTCRV